MSEYIFTESEIEALAFLFLVEIKKMKDGSVKKRLGENIFTELENYLYNDVMNGYPIMSIPSELTAVIPKLGIDEREASLFASYLGYCLLRRSDQDAVKIGLEPANQIDLLCLFREEIRAFKQRENEVVKQKAMKIAA